MPSASAMRSMCTSAANSVCGAPNPRNAPFGGVFVMTTRPLTRTWSQRYGPGGVQAPARQDDRAERAVGAAVHQHVDVHRRQAAVARHAGPVPDDGRVALGRGQHVLGAVVDQLHRPARLQRQQAGVPGDHRRVLLLAAEPAAGLRLHDADLVRRQAQQHRERPVHVVRALQRAVHGDAAVAGHGQHAVRLDVEVLLVAGPVLALDDEVGAPEALVDVALRDGDVLEHRGRLRRVEHGFAARGTRCRRRPRAGAPRSSWASSRIGSATWRTSPSARHGWSSVMSDTTLRPGMSRASTMVKPAVSKPRRRRAMSPQGMVERIVRAWSRPGSVRSST